MPKTTKQFKKKLPKGIDEDFVKEVESKSEAELNQMIVNYETETAECNRFLKGVPRSSDLKDVEAAEKLLDIKEAWDQAAGPTRETKTILKNRKNLVLDTLRKMGE